MTLNENYYYKVEGNISIWPGIKLTINDKTNNNEIGRIFILDIDIIYLYNIIYNF